MRAGRRGKERVGEMEEAGRGRERWIGIGAKDCGEVMVDRDKKRERKVAEIE